MPLLYGEVEANARKRLWEEISKRDREESNDLGNVLPSTQTGIREPFSEGSETDMATDSHLGSPTLSRSIVERSRSSSDVQRPDKKLASHESYQCPLCHRLLYEPVSTSCGHTTCRSCMARTARSLDMKIVDLDEQPENFGPVTGMFAICPICSSGPITVALSNFRFQRDLRTTFPSPWAKRKLQEDQSMERIHAVTIFIGNRHELIDQPDSGSSDPSNAHLWTFFVDSSCNEFIEEVNIQLHPTFYPNRIKRTQPPYSVQRRGWSVFTISGEVVLKPGYKWVNHATANELPGPRSSSTSTLPLQWNLDFGGKGSKARYKEKVKQDLNSRRIT